MDMTGRWDMTGTPESPTGPVGAQQRRLNLMAVASVVFGIVWLVGLGSFFALFYGYAARTQMAYEPEKYWGGRLAIAGIVLGTLALRTRSIWLGVFIHVSVALSMDVAAIWQKHW